MNTPELSPGAKAPSALILTVKVLLSLYCIAILTSMAAMEMFSWLSVIATLVAFSMSSNKKELFKFRLMPEGLLILLYVLIAIGTLKNNPLPLEQQLKSIGDARWILLFILLSMAVRVSFPARSKKFMLSVLGVAALVAVYAIVQYQTGFDLTRPDLLGSEDSEGNVFYRSGGLFGSPMTYGHSMGYFIFFPLAYLITHFKSRSRTYYAVLTMTTLIAISLATTFTRGVWLGVAIGALGVSAFAGKKVFLTISAIGITFTGLALTFSERVYNRFLTLFDPSYGSNSERLDLWRAHLEIFKEHPLFGIGYNLNDNFVHLAFKKLGIVDGFVGHAHNVFVQILASSGIIAFIVYFILFGFFAVTALRLYYSARTPLMLRTLALGAFGAQVFLHTGGLTQTNFFDGEVNHLVIFSWALLMVSWERSKK